MEFAGEVFLVGAANVAALAVTRRIFPESPWIQAFVAGALIHITAEVTGVNSAYCWRGRMTWVRQKQRLADEDKTNWMSKRSGCRKLLGPGYSSSDSSLLCSTE
jgi:hypothetical protein